MLVVPGRKWKKGLISTGLLSTALKLPYVRVFKIPPSLYLVLQIPLSPSFISQRFQQRWQLTQLFFDI
jgi:hypothetical protein